MANVKKRIVEVRAVQNCLAHALVIAFSKVDNDPNYDAFRKGRKIHHAIQTLLEMTVIDLSNGAGISELLHFQEHCLPRSDL